MNMRIRYYYPDPADEPAGAGPSAEQHAIDQPQDSASVDSKADSSADTEDHTNEDDTILGIGPDRSAGGLSGHGERTDRYDAAVMGIGD